MTDQPPKPDGLRLLGISIAYPRTLWSTLPFAFLCATIAYVAHLVWQPSPRAAEEPRPFWTPVVVMTNGLQTILPDLRRLEFWTPSAKTKDHLAKEGGAVRERDQWEILQSDDPVLQFGTLLRADPNVAGYRRTEIWGHGRTVVKPGWWWTVTAKTNYTVDTLMRTYREFWKSPNTVFVEVMENQGREDQ